MKKLCAFLSVFMVAVLVSMGATANTAIESAFDVGFSDFAFSPPLAAESAVSADTDNESIYTQTFEYFLTDTGSPVSRRANSRLSGPVALPAAPDITAFRLNLKVPWQYRQN